MLQGELRIGNYYFFNGEIVRIGYASLGDIAQKIKGLKNNYLNTFTVEPIPLTEEIFLKIGFQYEKACYNDFEVKGYYSFNNFVITVFDDDTFAYDSDGYVYLKHLHQLQNLFFVLESKELNML